MSDSQKIVFISRRCLDHGKVGALLYTGCQYAQEDTGFQLLEGVESGQELNNPASGILTTLEKACALAPEWTELLHSQPDTPTMWRKNPKGEFFSMPLPEELSND